MTSQAVDPRVLEQLHDAFGGDSSVLRRVIDNYLAGLDNRVAALRQAQSEPGTLSRAAHSLASPSATLGVRSIAEPCLAIERAVDDGRIDSVQFDALVDAVERAVEPARDALNSWLALSA
jgi:HPt (histidine-containing phosphotransfer) domain-containing protein